MQIPRRTSFGDKDELAVMFVNSVSGPKMYNFKEDGWKSYETSAVSLERQGENSQFYQVIGIDGGTLDYAAYTSDGELYDRVVIEKTGQKKKVIRNENTKPPQRSFGNTLPYKSPKF
jgi:hypothetical protein